MSGPALTFTMPTSLGDAVGRRDTVREPWLLSTPWGDERFHGTEVQARARLAARIRQCEQAEEGT